MFVKSISNFALVVLTVTALAATNFAGSSRNAQSQDEDIKPGESVFVFVSKKGGRAAPASASVSRAKAEVCISDYCRQQRSLKNSAPRINLGALAQKSLALGDELFKSRKFKEAIEAYQKSVKLKPNYTAYFGIGKANFELKQLDAAANAYEQATRLDAKLDDAFYNLGTIRFEQKNYAAALLALEQAVKIAPAESDEYYYYGLTLSELKQKDKAVVALEQAIKLNPKFFDAYNQLVDLYANLGRKDEAIANARRMIEIDPKNSQGFTNLGVIYFKDKKYAEALTALKEAVRLSPKEAQWWLNLAETEYDSEKYADAIVDYQKAIELKPELKKIEAVLYRFGYANLIINKFPEAINVLTECAAINPKNAFTFFGIAGAQMQSQPPDAAAAIENLNRTIILDPQNSSAFILLAVAHLQSSPPNVNAMLQAARRASSLNPNSAGTHFIVGSALIQARLFEAAESEIKEAVRIDPKNGIGWVLLCNASSLLKKYPEALEQCQKAVKLVPLENLALARRSLILVYIDMKRYDQAISEAQLLIKQYPDSADAYSILGTAYSEMKKFDKAIEVYKQAIRLDQQNSSYHLILGEIYWDAGKKEEARTEYAVLQNMDLNAAERLKLYLLTEKSKKK